MAELWDAYDIDGKRIPGMVLVRGEKIPNNVYCKIVNTAVRHKDGTYLLMKRHPKKHLALLWELSAGGACQKGEEPIDSIKRELYEETGILCDDFTLLGYSINYEHHTIQYEYLCVTDCEKDSIRLQEGETVDFNWVTRDELLAMDVCLLASRRNLRYIDELKSKVMVDLCEMTTPLAHKLFCGFKNDKALFKDENSFIEYVYDKNNVDTYVDDQLSKGRKLLAITYNGNPIGEVRFKNIQNNTAEIGIILKSDEYKNMGIGTKAVHLACFYARYELRLSSLTACILKSNSRSQHVFVKNGFSQIEEKDDFIIYVKQL